MVDSYANSSGVNPAIMFVAVLASILVAFFGQPVLQAAGVFIHMLFALALANRSTWLVRLAFLVAISLVFFIITYGISFPSLRADPSNMALALARWLKIVLLLTSVVAGVQIVRRRRLFSTFLRMGIPTYVIYPLFQAFVLVERFQEKAVSVLLALRLRGLRVRGPISRLLALVDAFSALFNGVLVEIDQRDLAHTSHGYHLMRSQRTPSPQAVLTVLDAVYLFVWTCFAIVWIWQWHP